MRHFLRAIVGPPSLPGRVFASAPARPLIRRTCATQRLAPADRLAVTEAVDLAVIAEGADAHLLAAPCAQELSNVTDHSDPGR
jgi:hypothetical protein